MTVSACVCKPSVQSTCTAACRRVELQTHKLLYKYKRVRDVHSAIARASSCAQVTVRRSVRERTVKSHTVPLLVELVRAHTFMLVDLPAIATKAPAVRCLSSTKTPNRRCLSAGGCLRYFEYLHQLITSNVPPY